MRQQHSLSQCFLRFVVLLLLAVGLTLVSPAAGTANDITAIPQEGCNLVVSELMSPTYAVVKLATPNHGWFAGTFTNLPIDQPVTFGLSMDGYDDGRTPANVTKWKGLRPVMTYADPLRYDSYVGYTKDAKGHWMADDPFLPVADRDAGTGQTPVQQAVPPDTAAQFLFPDGAAWYPWREVAQAHALSGVNVFRMTETFNQPTATLAMRVPYPYQYQQGMLERLQAAKLPGVFIDQLGQTPGEHTLSIIRLEPPDPTAAPTDRPTILAYAREHATEPDGSWVVDGMLRWLLSDDLTAKSARQQYDWLLIPLLDPDDAAKTQYTNANHFSNKPPVRPEAVAYATYLVRRIDAGQRLDVVMNFHNIECTEGPNLFTPMVNQVREKTIGALNENLWQTATTAGFTTGQPGWSMVGLANERLSGWCYQQFRTLDLFYEVNGRAPASRLDPSRLRLLGIILACHSINVLNSNAMAVVRAEIKDHLIARETERAAYWQANKNDADTRTPGGLLVLGY